MPRLFEQGTFDYVLKADRKLDKKDRAVFHLRILTPDENAKLEDSIVDSRHDILRNKKQEEIEVRQKVNAAAVSVETLKIGLEGWDNWIVDREEIPFKKPMAGLCSPVNIGKIHPKDRHELAEAITEGNTLSEEDSKNLESASGSEQAKTNKAVASAPSNQD